jgi:hypothetical protein
MCNEESLKSNISRCDNICLPHTNSSSLLEILSYHHKLLAFVITFCYRQVFQAKLRMWFSVLIHHIVVLMISSQTKTPIWRVADLILMSICLQPSLQYQSTFIINLSIFLTHFDLLKLKKLWSKQKNFEMFGVSLYLPARYHRSPCLFNQLQGIHWSPLGEIIEETAAS